MRQNNIRGALKPWLLKQQSFTQSQSPESDVERVGDFAELVNSKWRTHSLGLFLAGLLGGPLGRGDRCNIQTAVKHRATARTEAGGMSVYTGIMQTCNLASNQHMVKVYEQTLNPKP